MPLGKARNRDRMRRLNLELSEEAYQHLEALRRQMDKPSKAAVIRSGMALLNLYQREKLGVFDRDGSLISRIKLV